MKIKIVTFFSFLLCSFTLPAQQQISVTGTVTEGATGDPAIGVTVLVKGTTNGTVTDMDGNYTLNDVPVTATIVFSYIGMTTTEEPLNGRTVVNVIMTEDVQALEEVVVIGYGTARKRDLTGSIVTISADEIANRPSANPLASLQGKVSGVQIVNSGRAGQDPEIRIRGTNSVNGYKPLYIVDGLFSDNISYINPADIQSMEILKDPSSLAIFGMRGANGVIIITTKKAKAGQTIVNLNTSYGLKQIHDLIDVTNAAQFRELYDEQRINQGALPFDYTDWGADTNWQDEYFRTAYIFNGNASITGSTEKSKFYMGLGYTSEEGSIKTEKFSKITVNLSSDYNVTDFLKFGFAVNGSKNKLPDAKNVASVVRAAPIAPTYADYTDPLTNNSERLLHTMPDFQRAQLWNPLVETDIRGNHNLGVNHRAAGNIYGEVNFLKNFTFKTTLFLDYAINEARSFSPVIYFYNPEIPGKENMQNRQIMTQLKSTEYTAQSDYILTYQNRFDKHSITAMGGLTTNYREFSLLNGERSELLNKIYFNVPDNHDKWWLTSLSNDGARNQYDNNAIYQWRRFTMSYLLRGLYSYNDRYLLNASFRRDGSSVFRGVDNTWNNFYTFGGGWVISEEDFMAEQNVVDYLKLKGSWGVLGTENTGININNYYPTYPELTSVGSAVFGPNEDIIPGYTKIYNVQDLNWERTYSWEAGFEMNFLNQRLRLEPVYYHKRTKDIIVLLDSRGGAFNSLENLGDIENNGLELSASWNDRIGSSEFNYSLGANLTTINNKVITLGRDDGDAIYDGVARTVAGRPIGYFYGYMVEGVYQNNEDIKQSVPNTVYSVNPGDLKFKDINGDNVINQDDRTMIGQPHPDFTYGFNVSLDYKGLDFSMDMMGVYGNEIYRDWDVSSFAQFNYLTKRMKRWNGEGTSNWEPILEPSRAVNRAYSSYFIEDGSFFRIRNIQLGYTFSPSFLQKYYMKSLRLYANIENLKTWSKNSGYTPEIGGSAIRSGVDGGTYPMPAVYTVGLNITF
ncbi:MAG: SusC/RagA family protein [Bacteroidetes bacterium GWD2_45_23]|nr:MAG: SusC/RagA family protein [Bacteroidetes bacterium GWC2_46_850]OFX72407.1 MAG: SusC/RagA family protein [Bacteroidetes bacterium GWC1_47_7]OFX86327.1 MAG: SusC/RagA family protein [Bacteroidetes bacterium GWD2_45_23]HAR38007.1 SusC/RagA family protein [Porphyromonadaceae bacterium]HBA99695.1 SusC/RagA family protein [Porphyromonadaceae bacterium]